MWPLDGMALIPQSIVGASDPGHPWPMPLHRSFVRRHSIALES